MSLNRRSFLTLAGTAAATAALPATALAASGAADAPALASSGLPTTEQLLEGMHFVVGPTASGKTRLVRELARTAAESGKLVFLLSEFNESQHPPLPGYHECIVSVSNTDPDDYKNPVMALRQTLRLRPDLIVVDSRWTPNLVKMMAWTAMTGHGVLTTAFTGSTIETVHMVDDYLERSGRAAPLEHEEIRSVTTVGLRRTRRDGQPSIQRVTNTEWTDRTVRRLVAEGRLHDAHQALARVQQAA